MEYKQGIYEYKDGCGSEQRVILHIDGYWYLAGWEMPLGVADEKTFDAVAHSGIGELICEIDDAG